MKKLLALILALTLVFALSACSDEKTPAADGEKEIEFEELSAEKVMEKATEVTKDVTSLRARMDMDMNMAVNGETVDMNIVADMECDLEDGLVYMDMSMSGMGQDMEMETYIEYEDDTAIQYMNIMGTWMKQTVPVANLSGGSMGMSFDATGDLIKYLEGLENCTIEEDSGEYKIVGNFGDLITEEITSSVIESMGTLEITEESLETLLDCFRDVEYVMYIDVETFYPSRFEMDLGDAMRDFMEALAEESGQTIEVDEMDIRATVEYFDYNEDIDITIPEEALASEEVVTQ